MSYIHQETPAKTWAPKPLNAKGNLTQWQRRMNELNQLPIKPLVLNITAK